MDTEIPSIGDIKQFVAKLDIGVIEEFISKLESISTSTKATSAGSKSYSDKMLVAMSAVNAKMVGLKKQEMASKSESTFVSKDEEMASKSESASVSKDETAVNAKMVGLEKLEMASKSESASVSKDETAVNAKMVGPEKLEMASKSESASVSKDETAVNAKMVGPEKLEIASKSESTSVSKDEVSNVVDALVQKVKFNYNKLKSQDVEFTLEEYSEVVWRLACYMAEEECVPISMLSLVLFPDPLSRSIAVDDICHFVGKLLFLQDIDGPEKDLLSFPLWKEDVVGVGEYCEQNLAANKKGKKDATTSSSTFSSQAFPCGFCKKKFGTAGALQAHKAKHGTNK